MKNPWWLVIVMATSSLGCSSDAGHVRAKVDAGASSFARLRITLTIPREGDPAIATEARLLRYRDLDADSAQVLAGATAPSFDALPPGRCVRVDGEALLEDTLGTTSPDAAIEMLDAGDLVIRMGARTVRMLPRYAPQPLPFVSGVVYESDASGRDVLPPVEVNAGDEAFVSAYGGDDVGRFDAIASVPAPARFVAVDGQDPAAGPITINRGADLALRWSGDADDVVIGLMSSNGAEIRCRAPGGAFAIPRALVPDGELQLSVERLARTPFAAAGLSSGDVEVAVRDVVAIGGER